MDQQVEQCDWAAQHEQIKHIRHRVFIEEQGISQEDEWDERDSDASTQHFLANVDGQFVGYMRVIVDTIDIDTNTDTQTAGSHYTNPRPNQHTSCKLTRLAVLPEFRKLGLGRLLVQAATESALELNPDSVYLHAQTQAIALYDGLGFSQQGEQFDEAGIAHIRMDFAPDSATAITRLFQQRVLRLSQPSEYIQHICRMAKISARKLVISSKCLRSDIFAVTELVDAISAFARGDRRASVDILIHDAEPLKSQHAPIIHLARRLPSKITIKVVSRQYDENIEAALSFDGQFLVYFNDESKAIGFCCYQAKPESQKFLDAIKPVWVHHADKDPNFSQLNL